MKLLNQSILYLSASILLIIALWSVVFYYNMLDEIKESVDEGLEHYKRQIIANALNDSTLLNKNSYEEGFFAIREISFSHAKSAKDRYIDTILWMQDKDDTELEAEPVRMLSTAFENKGFYYELSVFNSMIEEDDLINELFWKAFWLYLILVGAIVIINNVVLERLWKPFYHFLYLLKSYRLGSSKTMPEVKTKTKEFMDLQTVVSGLLRQNMATFRQQKQFIEYASHELQTPLAIATNKLEMLLEKGGLKNAQVKSIAEVLDMVERLVRLNKSLLLLTKIENKQFFDNQKVSVNDIVRQSLDDLSEFTGFKNIGIMVSEKTSLNVLMDITLANIIISNLIRNSVFHNERNGSVKIDISHNLLRITNTATSGPLNQEKIFTRFYKSDATQAGIGLGLAIVKAVCSLYGFTPSYEFENQQHTFSILFNKI